MRLLWSTFEGNSIPSLWADKFFCSGFYAISWIGVRYVRITCTSQNESYKTRAARRWPPTRKFSLRGSVRSDKKSHLNICLRHRTTLTKMVRYPCVTGALQPHLFRGFLKKCLQKIKKIIQITATVQMCRQRYIASPCGDSVSNKRPGRAGRGTPPRRLSHRHQAPPKVGGQLNIFFYKTRGAKGWPPTRKCSLRGSVHSNKKSHLNICLRHRTTLTKMVRYACVTPPFI